METFSHPHPVEPKTFRNDVLIIGAEDTHYRVAGTLHNTLRLRGFRTSLARAGHEPGRKAIEESMIVIAILSKGNLSSPDYLEELAEVVHEKRMGQLFLPFLYNVEPAYVRDQICGVESEKFEKWNKVLTKVTDLTDFHFRDGVTYEYEWIEKIAQVVSEHAASIIGLIPRVKEVMPLLFSELGYGVNVVGICGVPGIGKKTIARGVYDDLIAGEGFDYHCLLDDLGEKLREHGTEHMLLSKMDDKNYMRFGKLGVGDNYYDKLRNFEEGMSAIKSTFEQKKVLTVFNGINCSDSLRAVLGLTPFFGPGSQVLVTSRDKHLLGSYGIGIYEVNGLDKTTGCQLLCLEAFDSMYMSLEYIDIISRAATCASGNPFALKVIGSNFRGKTIAECKIALDEYEKIPKADLIQSMIGENNRIPKSEDILEENMEYAMPDVEPASDDGSGMWNFQGFSTVLSKVF